MRSIFPIPTFLRTTNPVFGSGFSRIAFLLFLTTWSLASGHLAAQVYLDPNAPVEQRVDDLLGRMTLAEKIGQMTQAERGQFSGAGASNIATYHVGSILSAGGSSPSNNAADWVTMYNTFQNQALSTRLGIPLLYGIDAVHGHNNLYNAVIFPHNIGLGCTRNPDLVEECARITALEVAATGIDWTFSPCVAVPRNERWGRTYEGFAEDPALVGELGAAAVLGYQTDSLGGPNSILACAKHYVGDGGTDGGVDQGNTVISEADLRSIHLPPFQENMNQGVGSIMASFSQWNGLHLHQHEYLLTDVLKTELGFEGFVLSDWEGINKLPIASFDTAIANSINAGVDMAMQPVDYIDFQSRLTALVNAGVVDTTRINDAVRRILRIKFRMGLFEQPLADLSLVDTIGCQSHRDVARQAVSESLVLLKNDGVLPLSDNQNVLVAGFRGDDIGAQCGGWTIAWQGALGDITPGTTVREAVAGRIGAGQTQFTSSTNIPASDVAIVVVGEDPYAEGAGDRGPGHPGFSLSDADQDIIQAVKAAGIPMVVVLLTGRPIMLEGLLEDADAVVAAWLPGTEGGGITDILFGDVAPTGKLSMSWPRNEASVPINVGDPVYDPLFPYGFGLDYSTSSAEEALADQPLAATVFPNPFRERISVRLAGQRPFSVRLFDAAGRLLQTGTANGLPLLTLDTGALPAGVYTLQVLQGDAVYTQRILKP